ncbi:MAG: hypothetical protein RBU29_10170 [bacterium]|nr:hypothetical protein [bacterium]
MLAIGIALAGIVFARLLYVWAPAIPERMKQAFLAPYTVLFQKYQVDELYEDAVVNPYYRACKKIEWVDNTLIIGGLNKLAEAVTGAADRLRRIQTGAIALYAAATVAGMVFLVMWLLLWY